MALSAATTTPFSLHLTVHLRTKLRPPLHTGSNPGCPAGGVQYAGGVAPVQRRLPGQLDGSRDSPPPAPPRSQDGPPPAPPRTEPTASSPGPSCSSTEPSCSAEFPLFSTGPSCSSGPSHPGPSSSPGPSCTLPKASDEERRRADRLLARRLGLRLPQTDGLNDTSDSDDDDDDVEDDIDDDEDDIGNDEEDEDQEGQEEVRRIGRGSCEVAKDGFDSWGYLSEMRLRKRQDLGELQC